MGKTIRHTEGKWYRKPKGNGARKGEVRDGAIPPNSWDDLVVAAAEEDWFQSHPETEEASRVIKKKMKRLKKQGREFRRRGEDYDE